jgi:hypothetical protein
MVAGWEQDIDERHGYSPAKWKTEHLILGIGLELKPLVGSLMKTCRVKEKWLLRW